MTAKPQHSSRPPFPTVLSSVNFGHPEPLERMKGIWAARINLASMAVCELSIFTLQCFWMNRKCFSHVCMLLFFFFFHTALLRRNTCAPHLWNQCFFWLTWRWTRPTWAKRPSFADLDVPRREPRQDTTKSSNSKAQMDSKVSGLQEMDLIASLVDIVFPNRYNSRSPYEHVLETVIVDHPRSIWGSLYQSPPFWGSFCDLGTRSNFATRSVAFLMYFLCDWASFHSFHINGHGWLEISQACTVVSLYVSSVSDCVPPARSWFCPPFSGAQRFFREDLVSQTNHSIKTLKLEIEELKSEMKTAKTDMELRQNEPGGPVDRYVPLWCVKRAVSAESSADVWGPQKSSRTKSTRKSLQLSQWQVQHL